MSHNSAVTTLPYDYEIHYPAIITFIRINDLVRHSEAASHPGVTIKTPDNFRTATRW